MLCRVKIVSLHATQTRRTGSGVVVLEGGRGGGVNHSTNKDNACHRVWQLYYIIVVFEDLTKHPKTVDGGGGAT